MENQNKKKYVNDEEYSGLYWGSITIDELRMDLDALEKEGITHISVRTEDDSGHYINALTRRLETDDEFKKRVEKEKEAAEWGTQRAQKLYDRKLYEQLKKKFENGESKENGV